MEQDNSLSSTPSSVEGATPLNEPAPVAFNAQEYKPLVSRMFQARIKTPSVNLDTFRPADFKGTDEDWDSLTVNAEVEYQKARKNAFGEISTLVGSSKTLGYGWKDGVWSAKNLPSELKNAIASKVLIQFPNSYSSMKAFRQCWNASSVEELGEMIATNVGLQMQTKEERARAWSGLSESERISMAKSIQEQYNVKNPVVPSDGENARIIVDYYTEAGQKFYEASLSACADDEETKVSFALSLMSDGKRTETLKNIVNSKGIDVAARVAESAYALKAYHDGNIFGVFASSTLEGIKEGIGAGFDSVSEMFDATLFEGSAWGAERNFFAGVNKAFIEQGKKIPTPSDIAKLSDDEIINLAVSLGEYDKVRVQKTVRLGSREEQAKHWRDLFAEGYNQFAGKFAEAKGKEVAGKKFTDGSWMRYADMAGRSLGYMAPIVASGFIPGVGPGAAIGIGFAQGYDEFVDEIYANGDVTMTNEEVALGGSLYGAFYAGTNFFGGKVATYGLDYVKGIVGRSAAKSVVDFNKRGVFQFVKDSINLDSKMFLAKWADGIAMRASAYAARALIREGSIAVGEGVQEASEDLARWAIAKSVSEYARDYKGKDYLQEKDIVDSMLESFKHGFILSGVQRGVFGGTREVLSGFGGTRSALNREEILGGNNMFTATRDKLFSYVAYEQAFKARGEGFAERKGVFQLNKLANDFISGDEKARTELRNGDAYGKLTTEQKERLETLAHVKDQLSKEGLFDFTEQVKYGRDVKGENGVRFTREESELAIKLFRAKSTLFNILARKSYYEQSLKESKSDADKKLTQASLERYALREDVVRKYIERASKELESLEGRSLKNSRLGSDSFSESKLLEGYKIASELGNEEAKAIAREIAEIYGVELDDSKPEGTAQPPTPAPEGTAQPPTPAPEGTQGEPVENSDENKQVPETPLNSDEKSTNEEPVKISTPEPAYSDNEPKTRADATEKASSEGISAEELPIERLAEKYEEKFGNVLSTDNAKLLFDGYNPHDVKSISSFHAKAGAIISKLFDYFLNTKKNAGDGSVVYTAGGVGSGKSTVVNSFKKTADFVMDSTMAGNIAYTRDGINKVLNNGQKAVLVYVYRDAKDAWYNGVLKRAKTSTGHVVSRKTFTSTHTKAYENFKKIVDEFGDKVEVKVFEIVDGVAPIQISLQDLETKRFYTEEELGDIYDGKIPDEARPEQNARADRPADSGRTGDAVPSDLRDEGGNRGMESENAGDGTSANADGQGAGIEDGSSAPDISGRRSSESEPEGGTDKSAKANDSDNRELESSSPAREDSLPVADESGYDSVEPTQAEKPSLSAEETKKRVSQLRQKVAEIVEREYPDVVSEIDIVIWAEDLGLNITPSQCKAILFDALFGKNKKAINDLRKNGERGKAFFKAITDSVYAISFVKAESDLDIVGKLVEAANYWNKLKTSTILHDEALSADGIELQNILLNFADGTPETLKIYIGALGALSTFRNEYKAKDSSWWDGTIKEDIPFVASAIGFYAKYPSEVNVADSVLGMIREIAKGDEESLIALRGYLAERSRVYDKTGTFDFDGSGASATVSAPVNATQDAIAGAAEDLKRTEEPKKKRTSKKASNEPDSPEKRIESFGEEVIGNRDMWNSYRKTLSDITKEQLQAKTLSDVFPRPNAFGLVKSGNVSADVAALTLYIYNSIPPKTRYSEGYWLDSVLKASKIIQMLIEDKELAEKYLDNLRETAKKTETVGKFTVQTNDSIRAENTILYVDTLKALGFPEKNVKLGKKRITVSHYVNKDSDTRYSHYVIRNGNSRVKGFDSFEKAVDALRSMVDSGKGKTRGEAKIELKLFKDRVSKEIFIAVGNTSSYQKLKGGFKDWQTARAYIEENRASLEELYRRIKDIPSERNAENAERIGADWRKGKDVSEAQFAETFGFRGVRFGKWVEQDKRQEDLNDAFDALMDLADLLGVSPKALSLNGELALAFGALGHSDASAHYESGNKVINLTKKHGAGSLAHEWWHALDNYFGAMSGSGMSMITEARKLDEDNIRKEVAEVFFAVRDAIFNSKLAERSKALDGLSSGKPYWGTIVEMTARAFESWVKDTIDRDGRSNDYLANISSLDEWQQKRPKSDGVDFDDYPYPLPSEMESLGTLFRALADTIEERTGENGSVALYQMPTTEAMTISEADQRLLVKHVEGFVPGATVQIVDDVEAAAGEADRKYRYQIAQEEHDAWNAILDKYETGTLQRRGMNTVLERTPAVLQRCGANDLPIRISKTVLDKITKDKHRVPVSELRKLLTNIDNPIAVFRSRTQADSLVVLTEIKDAATGKNAIVALRLDTKESGGGHEINAVASIYGKNPFAVNGMLEDGLAVYVNQKKTRAYLQSNRLQLPAEASKRGNPSLLTEEDFSNDELGVIKSKQISEMRDLNGVFGAYVPDTKQVFVAKNARVDTLLHELGWHATFHWAESNAPELYKLMKRYASEAPAELKSKVADVYGYKDGKISDAEFLDECGAALFSEQNKDLMESLLAQLQGRGVKVKARNWWKKFVEAVKAVWAKLVKSRSDEVAEQDDKYADIARIFSGNSDNPAGAMRELAQAFADGKALRAGTVPSGNASPLRERVGHKRVLFQRADDGAKAAMLTVPRDGVWRKWRDKVSEIHSLKIVVREGIYNADMEKARLIYQRAKEAAAGKKVLKASTLTDDELKKNMKGLGIEKLGSAAWGIEGWSKKVHDKLKKHFEGKEGVGDDYILELWKTIVVPSFDMAALKTLSKENVAVLAKLTEAIENAKSFDEALKLADDAESKLKNRAEEGLINEHRDQLLKLIGKYKGRWDKHQTKLNSQRKTEGLSEYYLHALATLNGYLESGDTESLERDIKNAEASLDSAASDEAKLQANMFLSAASDLGNTPISDMGDEQVMSLLDKAETLFTDGVATLEAAKKEREEAVEASFGAIIKAIYKAYKKESGKVEKKSIRNYFRLGYSIRDKFDVLISSAPPEFRAAAYMAAQDLALRMTHCETKQGAILADDASAFIEAFAEQFGEGKDKELLGRVLRRGKGRGMAEWRIERKYLIPILMEKRDGSEDFSRYGKKLTNAQLLYQYLAISQREHDHLFKRATEEDIKGFDDEKKALYNRWKNKEALKEFLGEKLVAFGDKLVEIMESHAEAIDKQSVRDTGLPLSYKRKGYFPIVRNLEKYMTDVAIQGKSPIIPKVLIPRTHSSYDIDEEADVISVFRRHSFDVAHYITHGELNQELRLILESDSFKDFRKHIAAVGGEAFSEDFAKHLQDVISGRMAGSEYYNPSAKVMDKAVRLGRWIARVCALGLNVISGLKQVLGGMASFANDYGFINLLKAVMSNSQDMMANWEEIYESDGYQTRYPGMSLGRAMTTARLMNNDFVGNKLGRVLMWGVQVEQSLMFMTANGDKVPLFLVGSSLYGALKEYYYGKGNITREEAKARAMADFWERVDRCQQARMVHNTDTISRGSNELKKAFVQFLTAPLQFASAEIKAVEMVANTDGSKDAWNQLANVATHNHIVEPGLMLLASLVAYSLSDDDEFDWERNMQPFIFGSMDSIPLIGGAAEFLVSDQYKTSAWSTAAFDFPTNIMRRSKAAVKTLWDGEEDTTRPAINKVFRTVTIIRQVEDIYGKIAEEE